MKEMGMEANPMEKAFTSIYQNSVWGNNGSTEYRGSSGPGSSVEYNVEYIAFLRKFISDNDIKSVVDVGCGDWRIGEALFDGLDLEYTGYDVYGDLVAHLNKKHGGPKRSFIKLDSSTDKESVKDADLLVCKDVLQHWDDQSVVDFIEWVTKSGKFKYALITNCRGGSIQGHIGGHRGLDASHALIANKGFSKVFQYNSKETILFSKLKKVMRNKNGIEGLKNLCKKIKQKITSNINVFVEIGSFMGESSEIFSNEFPNAKIYCVDPWLSGYDDSDVASRFDFFDVEKQFDLRTKNLNNIIKIKKFSTNFKINCDIVYIDGRHFYEGVKEDIKHWLPFTNKAICGHDYFENEKSCPNHLKGVGKAVRELLSKPDETFIDSSWLKWKM